MTGSTGPLVRQNEWRRRSVKQAKIFLDTNVPRKLTDESYRAAAEQIVSSIAAEYRMVASVPTFCELIETIRKGDEEHFQLHQAMFNWMTGPGRVDFLRMPGDFALHRLFGLESLTKVHPDDCRDALEAIRRARSREDLLDGKVQMLRRGRWRTAGLQIDVIPRQHEEGRQLHRQWLENIRDEVTTLRSPVLWAVGYAELLGQKISDEQAQEFSVGLDAVYAYDKMLCRIVKSATYNFAKHKSDWIDRQQLHYLCDPDIYLLTDDKHLRTRVVSSAQAARVLVFREFLREHGFTPQH